MRRLMILVCVVAVCVFALAACSGKDYDEGIAEVEDMIAETTKEPMEEENGGERAEIVPLTLQDVLGIASRRRESIVKPDYNILLAMTAGRTPIPGHPDGFFGDRGRGEPLITVTVEDAIADAWELFGLLRDVYGGYVYFGGDEVFYAIFEEIETELLGLGSTVGYAVFVNVLYRNLSRAVVDNHFVIGNRRFGRDIAFFYPSGLYYDRSKNGFRNRETQLYLEHIEGHDINDVMRLHINDNGELFYRPVLLIEEISDQRVQVYFMYEDGERARRMLRRESFEWRERQYPSLEFIDGIPVVTVMTMGFDGHENALNIEHAVPFLSFAEELRDEPVVIVDIRGNGGGNGFLPTRWLYALTGEIVPSNYVSLSTWEYNPESHAFDPENVFQNPPGIVEKFMSAGPFGEGYTVSNNEPRRIIEREQMLILLTDRGTASAAEGFTDHAFNMTNTLVIGTSTGGVLAFDMTYPQLYLSNTGTPFGLGRTMMLWPDGHFAEGVGIQPDIWASGDALTAALALVRNEVGR
ncbi:MAG: S41 family peptidase [Defluviitaleaceae bacterium]|nr:S41 family peptidase [Defluviitaleaceae bacterium]